MCQQQAAHGPSPHLHQAQLLFLARHLGGCGCLLGHLRTASAGGVLAWGASRAAAPGPSGRHARQKELWHFKPTSIFPSNSAPPPPWLPQSGEPPPPSQHLQTGPQSEVASLEQQGAPATLQPGTAERPHMPHHQGPAPCAPNRHSPVMPGAGRYCTLAACSFQCTTSCFSRAMSRLMRSCAVRRRPGC